MTELTQNLSLAQVRSLIDSYDFDLGCDRIEELLQCWSEVYAANWIRLATIEALYQGRYKAVSIEQILNVWMRLGAPNTHFTYEFERLICRKLPKHLNNFEKNPEKTDAPPKAEIDFEPFTYEPVNQEVDAATVEVSPQIVEIQEPERKELENLSVKKISKQPEATDNSATDNSATDNSARESSVTFISALGLSYSSDWSDFTIGGKMIHQFIPLPDMSSFFNKLKTFGEQQQEGSLPQD